MSFVTEQPIDLVEKLRISERLASHIIREGQLHAESKDLRLALGSNGTTVHAVLKNWVLGLIESWPDQFYSMEEAEHFVGGALREKMLETFPGNCEF